MVGIERFFTDRVFTTAVLGSGSNRTTTGWGVGGSALMPVWPKVIDLQGSVLYGAGLGRYASSQLPDVTIGPDGTLTPLTTFQFLVGAVIHPVEPLDLFMCTTAESNSSPAIGELASSMAAMAIRTFSTRAA